MQDPGRLSSRNDTFSSLYHASGPNQFSNPEVDHWRVRNPSRREPDMAQHHRRFFFPTTPVLGTSGLNVRSSIINPHPLKGTRAVLTTDWIRSDER